MPRIKLTKSTIDALPTPSSDVVYWDANGANPITFDPGEQLSEAWPGLYGVGTTHRRIVELAHEFVPGPLSERADGVALPFVAVLSAPTLAAPEVRI